MLCGSYPLLNMNVLVQIKRIDKIITTLSLVIIWFILITLVSLTNLVPSVASRCLLLVHLGP